MKPGSKSDLTVTESMKSWARCMCLISDTSRLGQSSQNKYFEENANLCFKILPMQEQINSPSKHVYWTEVRKSATKIWSWLELMSSFCLPFAVNGACSTAIPEETERLYKNRSFILHFFTSLIIERDKNSAQPVSEQICFLKSCFKDPENYSERENNKSLTSVREGTETVSHLTSFWISAWPQIYSWFWSWITLKKIK